MGIQRVRMGLIVVMVVPAGCARRSWRSIGSFGRSGTRGQRPGSRANSDARARLREGNCGWG